MNQTEFEYQGKRHRDGCVPMLILLICLLVASSCFRPVKKPFIIVTKAIDYSGIGKAQYTYKDADGVTADFYETNTKYNIGDTIK